MKENERIENVKRSSPWRKRLLYTVLFLFLLPVLFFFLIQWPPVQNKVVDYMISRISNSIEGEVSIDRVDISIEDGLKLVGFNLIGTQSDTILSANSLDVSLTQSLYSLFDNTVAIDAINLDSPQVKITTYEGERESNLSKIISSLNRPTNESSVGKSFNIDIKKIKLTNVGLLIKDENTKQTLSVDVTRGNIVINSFLEDGGVDIEQLILDQPVIRIVKEGKGITIQNESEELAEVLDTVANSKRPTTIFLRQALIKKGIFSLEDKNKEKLRYSDVLDYGHFEISDIDLEVCDMTIKGNDDIHFNLERLDFIDDKGFEVKSLTSENTIISSDYISFPNFSFITDRTNLSKSIALDFDSFADFSAFEQKVNIYSNLTSSRIYLGDIMHFVEKLNRSPFFIQNKNKTVSLSGKVSGVIDNLSGQKVNIKVGNELVLDASFSTRKLTTKDREFLDVRMKNLRTNIQFLKSFIPGFTPPDNFDKLGDITFNGSFYGYLRDFVVFGGLRSDMGDAFLDMRLDIKDGSSLAQYSGELSVEQFNLGDWTDNQNFGLVDFSAAITDGKGLTLNSVYSDLYATVESLTFKDYEYRDFVMDAQVDKSKFNGEFSISDENIDFVFDGSIEMKDSIPHLDFKANIEQIDFEKLNLVSKPLAIQGNIDINGYGKNINDVVGTMIASDIRVVANDTLYTMDTVSVTAYAAGFKNREIKLFSDIASIELEGDYDLASLLPATKGLLKTNYPHFTQNWPTVDRINQTEQDLRFDISIFDSRNYFDLAGVKDLRTKNFKAKGSLDTRKGDLSFASSIPFLGIQNNSFWDTQLLISSDNNSGDVLINIDSTVIGGYSFNPIDIQSRMTGDTIEFLVSTKELVDSLESLDIQGRMVPHPKGYALNITDNKIEALGGIWSFEEKNEIVIGSKYHKIENLRMSDGKRSITIDDVENKGLAMYLADFNFRTINGLIDYRKMSFAGEGDLSVFVDNVYENPNVEANMYIENFTINDDSYGTLEIDVSKDADKPVNLLLSLGNSKQELVVNASLDPENDNEVAATVETKTFPLHIFEYLLGDGIKNTYGGVDLKAKVNGPVSDLKIDGKGDLNGGVTIIYTGVDYKFVNQEVRITEKVIDLTGAEILDPEGGIGYIDGGLNHNTFKNFTIDALISGRDVVALNTTKFDNPLYYGYGKGDMSVKFTGPFHLVNMKIDANAKEGSTLNIPISEGETTTDKNFIKFVKRENLFAPTPNDEKAFRFEGLDIAIDMTMTPEARVNIIFDESRGDVIQGHGRGNIKMNITRYGDFDMYGTYEIERGEYLFTALGAVAKPFQVRRGGQIRWTGDPINATLNIVADYEVRTAMDVFLSEFVVNNPKLEAASRSKTQVELILNLGGTLFKPNVNFDLDFPDLQGELRTVVQSKMRTLNANQAELNSQVLGLVVFNSFLPSNSSNIALGGSDLGSAGIGTLSEFISSQASLLFTGLLNEVFADNGLISGFDFDIGLRKNSFNGVQNNNNALAPDEIEVNLKNRFKFLDERLSLDLGGNYVWDNVLSGQAVGNYFIGNFVLEYFLTDDRKLKLRMYGRYDFDEIEAVRRQKYGLGVGYRTEFGTLSDFKQTMAEQFRVGDADEKGKKQE
ncbi:MAG: hypothetical protein ACJA1A_000920 [Saprospiraceae bacterium]|jgi:hypothetical protein